MSNHFPDIAAALELVVGLIKGADIEAAVNTSEVNAPGCWVRLSPTDPFPVDLLSGEGFVGVDVSVVVGAMPLLDAYRALCELGDKVVDVLGHPDGPVRPQATVFGHDPVELPTLVMPYHVGVSKEGSPIE